MNSDSEAERIYLEIKKKQNDSNKNLQTDKSQPSCGKNSNEMLYTSLASTMNNDSAVKSVYQDILKQQNLPNRGLIQSQLLHDSKKVNSDHHHFAQNSTKHNDSETEQVYYNILEQRNQSKRGLQHSHSNFIQESSMNSDSEAERIYLEIMKKQNDSGKSFQTDQSQPSGGTNSNEILFFGSTMSNDSAAESVYQHILKQQNLQGRDLIVPQQTDDSKQVNSDHHHFAQNSTKHNDSEKEKVYNNISQQRILSKRELQHSHPNFGQGSSMNSDLETELVYLELIKKQNDPGMSFQPRGGANSKGIIYPNLGSIMYNDSDAKRVYQDILKQQNHPDSHLSPNNKNADSVHQHHVGRDSTKHNDSETEQVYYNILQQKALSKRELPSSQPNSCQKSIMKSDLETEHVYQLILNNENISGNSFNLNQSPTPPSEATFHKVSKPGFRSTVSQSESDSDSERVYQDILNQFGHESKTSNDPDSEREYQDILKQQNLTGRNLIPSQLPHDDEKVASVNLNQFGHESKKSNDSDSEREYQDILKQQNLTGRNLIPIQLPHDVEKVDSVNLNQFGHESKKSNDLETEEVYRNILQQRPLSKRGFQSSLSNLGQKLSMNSNSDNKRAHRETIKLQNKSYTTFQTEQSPHNLSSATVNPHKILNSGFESIMSNDSVTEQVYKYILNQQNGAASSHEMPNLGLDSTSNSDLVAERIYQDIINRKNLSGKDLKAAQPHKEGVQTFSHKMHVYGSDSTKNSNSDTEKIYKDFLEQQNLSKRDEVEHDLSRKHRQIDGTKCNFNDKNEISATETHNSSQKSSTSTGSSMERAYADIMGRYGQIHPHYLLHERGDEMTESAHSWDSHNSRHVSSTNVARSDSIQNLLEAMYSMGIDFFEMRNKSEPPLNQQSKMLNKEMESSQLNHDSLNSSRSSTVVNNAEINVQEKNSLSKVSNFGSGDDETGKIKNVPHDDPISAVINSSDEESKKGKYGMICSSIQELLLQGLQASGDFNEDSVNAVNETVHEFSQWINKAVKEIDRLKNEDTSYRLSSFEDSNKNRCVNDIVTIKEISVGEIGKLDFFNNTSKQELFKSGSGDVVMSHLMTNSKQKTIIVRKKIEKGQWKNWLLEINPDVSIKASFTPSACNTKQLFTLKMEKSNSSISLIL